MLDGIGRQLGQETPGGLSQYVHTACQAVCRYRGLHQPPDPLDQVVLGEGACEREVIATILLLTSESTCRTGASRGRAPRHPRRCSDRGKRERLQLMALAVSQLRSQHLCSPLAPCCARSVPNF